MFFVAINCSIRSIPYTAPPRSGEPAQVENNIFCFPKWPGLVRAGKAAAEERYSLARPQPANVHRDEISRSGETLTPT